MNQKRRLTFSLDAKDYEALVQLAREEDRSLSWTVCQAVRVLLRRSAGHQPTLPFVREDEPDSDKAPRRPAASARRTTENA